MKDMQLIRTEQGFAPLHDEDWEIAKKIPISSYCVGDISVPRHEVNHRRMFALLRFAYNTWEPPEYVDLDGVDVPVTKNFDQFREDIAKLAGHRDIVVDVQGNVIVRARSISYRAVENDVKFMALYASFKDAIWEMIFSSIQGYTEQEFENAVAEFMRF